MIDEDPLPTSKRDEDLNPTLGEVLSPRVADEDLGPIVVEAPSPQVGTDPYDPRPRRENTRTYLAIGFAIVLGLLVVVPIASIAAFDGEWSSFEPALETLLPAIIGVTGTILGFYFGSEKEQ